MAIEKFSKDHEWVRVDGDIATIGITDHAQEQLGDVVFVEVPEVGRKVSAGEAVAVVESVKAASDVYAPVSGEVVEANADLAGNSGARQRGSRRQGLVLQAAARQPGRARRADGPRTPTTPSSKRAPDALSPPDHRRPPRHAGRASASAASTICSPTCPSGKLLAEPA